jgi:hypothetical protein
MPGLRSRIDRLAHRLGTDAPRRAVIFYGPHYDRHDINRSAGDTLHLTVPCPWDGDPMEYLSPKQRAAIGGVDSLVCFEGFHDGRDRLASFEIVDDGRNAP